MYRQVIEMGCPERFGSDTCVSRQPKKPQRISSSWKVPSPAGRGCMSKSLRMGRKQSAKHDSLHNLHLTSLLDDSTGGTESSQQLNMMSLDESVPESRSP
ncbi:uncharacterized protein UV8b_07568 [Ustilaginoidea virens]|uniref:Uncharacterized protein n=1 Tax=Ustilaginoidea virens TaxID=1159556 RepID=A0A8E5MKN1_USTVR|nr:uncharacterized protein UV8b_07568 [Ustilaginoidea virens]QUC23327.1 hypothetical protein UV8b_07568 [Ustilaginoidea virens]